LKRNVLLILLAFGLIAMVFAQGPKQEGKSFPGPAVSAGPKRAEGPAPGDRNPGPRAEVKPVTVSGDIIIVRGSPAVKSGDVTYLLNRNFSLFGLVDGLKEGAKVTIEGKSMGGQRDSNVMFLIPSKLTFNGKTYEDLEPPVFRMGQGKDGQGRPGPRQQGNSRRPAQPQGRNRR